MAAQQHVMVLLSGGLDSAACAARFKADGASVVGIFVDYGQPAAAREAQAATAISDHLSIPLKRISVDGVLPPGVGYVPGRNAMLIQLGIAAFDQPAGLLAIGLIAGAHYVDCTPTFVATAQRLLDLYFDGRVQLAAPFIHQSKGQVLGELQRNGFPISLTYSCEAGTDPVCGKCLSCRDRGPL